MLKKKGVKKTTIAVWAAIKPRTGFQLALVILFLLSMVVGVWAISNSQELRSQAAGKKIKDTCAANSDAVCKGKKIGKEVTKDGQRGKCEAKKKPKAGENVKCVFKASTKKSISTPDAPEFVQRDVSESFDKGEKDKPDPLNYLPCEDSTTWNKSEPLAGGYEYCIKNDELVKRCKAGYFIRRIDSVATCVVQ